MLRASFFRVPDAEWVFGSSPVVDDGVVYVQADVIDGGFLAAFSLEDGSELWRTARSDVPTWSTPTIHQVGERKLVLVSRGGSLLASARVPECCPPGWCIEGPA